MMQLLRLVVCYLTIIISFAFGTSLSATPFTMTSPGGVAVPTDYPQAGGAVIILTGVNDNIYYQFSDPTGAFRGFNNNGRPRAFQGNPFTINDPIPLDCGFSSCATYFGGALKKMEVRFTAYDGDTQGTSTSTSGRGFDYNDIELIMNGVSVGNWSNRQTQVTTEDGATAVGGNNGFVTGFGNNTLNTGWFSSTDATLLGNVLATGQTTTQVRDADPNDNYWDFRFGDPLSSEAIRTVAPGYELTKKRTPSGTTYAAVDEQITYEYIVTNIGSVNISNIAVVDDKITSPNVVTCDTTFLAKTASGGTANFATCTATYTVKQEDIDSGTLTNKAVATGSPEYGQLGTLNATVTLTGPAKDNKLILEKTANVATFSALNDPIVYTFKAKNTGNTTLTNVVVTDPLLPGLSCTIAKIEPLSSVNTVNEASCSATYNVTQADMDRADAGTALVNTASATARDPDNALVNSQTPDPSVTITGPNSTPAITLLKESPTTTFAAVNDVIQYTFKATNSGPVTWPGPPTITDPTAGTVTCPAGSVAPGSFVTCTASYTVTQNDLNAEKVVNNASATVTVNGTAATDSGTATVNATITPTMTLTKTLKTGPNPYSATTDQLVYEYVITNTSNVLMNTIALTDDKLGAITCPVAQLAPTASTTCTSSSYTIQQSDLNSGSITNIATLTAKRFAGTAITPVTATLTVNATQSPAMSLVKTAQTIAAVNFGSTSTVDYTYTVTNTGNVTLGDTANGGSVIQITDDKFATASNSTGTVYQNPLSCPAGAVVPGGQVVCTATYDVTTTDINNGFILNTAKAKSGSVESNEDSATVPDSGTPGITFTKEATDSAGNVIANPTFTSTSDTLYYKFTAKNTGETTWSRGPGSFNERIRISDDHIGSRSNQAPFTCDQGNPSLVHPVGNAGGLTPTEVVCTASFSGITQADIDAGFLTNEAFADFRYRDPASVDTIIESAKDTSTATLNITPDFTFLKEDQSGGTFSALNDVVTFKFTMQNQSVQTISSIAITDPDIATITCPTLAGGAPTPLGPKNSATDTLVCTGTYTITQANVDAGTYTNTASATATTPTGATIGPKTATDTITLAPGARNERFNFEKLASTTTFNAVNDTIDYTFKVTNTGNVTLKNIAIADVPLGFNCTIATLAVGAIDTTTCKVTKTFVQADLDSGTFTNTASASTTGYTFPTNPTVTATYPSRNADFTFVKESGDTYSKPNDVINYTFTIKNTGTVTLTGITIVDNDVSPALNCGVPDLAPGAMDSTTCTAAYTVNQADIDKGSFSNTATANVNSLVSGAQAKTATKTVNAVAENAVLFISKVEDDGNAKFGQVNATEAFTIFIRNDGNVTLKTVNITDPKTGLSCTVADLAPGATATQCADGTTNFNQTYSIVQADVDAGSLTNTVTATAVTEQGTTLSETAKVVMLGPDQLPALEVVKTATAGADYKAVGETLAYNYVVENKGNITLTSAITVADDFTTVNCPALPAAGLAPGGKITCTSSYMATQQDLDNGQVLNTASASTLQAVIPNSTHPTGSASVTSPDATATVSADQLPALSITKAVKSGTPSTYDGLDDTITYVFEVTNSGNVTTTGQITVNDTTIGKNAVCGPVSGIAPGAKVSCQMTYTPDQNDIDTGFFDNTATADMLFNGAAVQGTSNSVRATAVQQPELTIVKAYTGGLTAFSSGQEAEYSYVITNTGNETVKGPITVEDNLIASVTCPAAATVATFRLAPKTLTQPGESVTCTGKYTLGASDIELGSTTNVASVKSPTVNSVTASATIPVGANPAMGLIKQATDSSFKLGSDVSFNAVANTITYTYTISNDSTGDPASGTIAPSLARKVIIEDDRFPATPEFVCWEPNGTDTEIPPEANPPSALNERSCTRVYTVTQADLDAIRAEPGGAAGALDSAFVTNVAVAKTTFGPPATVVDVVSSPQTVTVDGVEAASLLVTKTASSADNPALVNSVVTFTISIKNDGNQTISGIVPNDPMLTGLSCTIGGAAAASGFSLAPTQEAICAGTYTVKQSDVDAQALSNTASVAGSDPTGAPISRTASVSYPVDGDRASVGIVKTLASGTPAAAFTDAGQTITYNIAVTNTGNITLISTAVTDILFPGQTCTIGTLAPMASDTTTCSFTYEVKQSDIDAGEINNTATATSQVASTATPPVAAQSSIKSNGPLREPKIAVSKTSDVTQVTDQNQTVTYSYLVLNTGNVTLTSLPQISDDKIIAPNAVTCPALPAGGIPPRGTITCTAQYTSTLADMNAGKIVNIADFVVANPLAGGADLTAQATKTVTAVQSPSVTVDKTVSDAADVVAGQTLTYAYKVTNNGNVTLSNINVVDAHTTKAGTSNLTVSNGGTIPSIDPGQSVTLNATYVVTQDDIDDGRRITNEVTVTGDTPTGAPALTAVKDDVFVTMAPQVPAVEVTKTAAALPANYAVNTPVEFTIVVKNTGNVSLATVSLTDNLSRLNNAVIAPDPVPVRTGPAATKLGVGEEWTYKFTHNLTQADIDAGGIKNTATASVTAATPTGQTASDISHNASGAGSTPTTVLVPAKPEVTTAKRITAGPTGLNQTVEFEIDVTNTGNVTLTNVSVSDKDFKDAQGVALTLSSGPTFDRDTIAPTLAGTLAVGETATYKASYTITQATIDAGGLTNSATATGTPPAGLGLLPVTDDIDAPVTLAIPETIAISMVKNRTSAETSYDKVGQVLTYTFTIKNDSNITLTKPFAVEDAMITNAGKTITCGAPPVAPGGTVDCVGEYAVTQTDLNNGSVVNRAKGVYDGIKSSEASETVPAAQDPKVEFTKTAVAITSSGTRYTTIESKDFTVGAVVEYKFTVKNIGNVSLINTPVVTDDKIAAITCDPMPAGGLLPQASVECNATYALTSTDVQVTQLTNTASVKVDAAPPVGASSTIPAGGTPLLTFTKSFVEVEKADSSIDPDGLFDTIGDKIVYEFKVVNDGTVPFANPVNIIDPRLPTNPFACYTPSGADPDFRPTETITCRAKVTVTQDDFDAGQLINEAKAETTFGATTTTVPSNFDKVTTLAKEEPSLSLVKAASVTKKFAVGEVVTFTYTVTNTGNQTLDSITVTDPRDPTFSCTVPALAPGQTDSSCTLAYTVTQADVDAGEINMTTAPASVTGSSPTTARAPQQVSANSPLNLPVVDANPLMSMTKAGTPDPFGVPGTKVDFVFTVKNDGNVTLRDVMVTDAVLSSPAYTCSVPILPVGGTDDTCRFAYEVQQKDFDAGTIVNNATAVATDPFGAKPPATATTTVTAIAPTPGLEVTKTASNTTPVRDAIVTYTLALDNTGDVSLDTIAIADTMTRNDGTATSLTTAFTYASGDTDGDGKIGVTEIWLYTATKTISQADIDAGGFTNSATVTSQDPFNTVVTDKSDNGNDTDGNIVDDATAFDITPNGSMAVLKTAAPLSLNPMAGDTAQFTVTVENNGNVTLKDVVVSDSLTRADGTVITPAPTPVYTSGDTNADGIMSVGEKWVYQVNHALTQGDIDGGGLLNSATAFANTPKNLAVSDVSDTGSGNGSTATPLAVPEAGSIVTVKRITDPQTTVGSTVKFEIDAMNNGNVTLTGVTVTDTGFKRADGTALVLTSGPTFAFSDKTSVAGTLKVGETATYRATYTLTQADIDAGGVENAATVTGKTPTGVTKTDGTDSPSKLPITAAPTLSVVKTLKSGGPTFQTVGQELTYLFTVKNTGNVTLNDPVTINDPMITNAGAAITCQPTPLAPQATLACEGTYKVTQKNINDGEIINKATAQHLTTISPEATARVQAIQNPSVATVKKAEAITVNGTRHSTIESQYFVTGAIVEYSYTVTNTGNVTFTDPIVVSDNRIANVNCPPLPTGGLVPTANHVCSATYTVTRDDVRLGVVTNAASATVAGTTSPLVTETVPANGVPALSTTKTLREVRKADGSTDPNGQFDKLGDQLVYEFSVVNKGTVAFAADVVIQDARLAGPLVCFTSTALNPDLVPNEEVTCEGIVTVTQDDLDNGKLFNEALAKTTFGATNIEVISAPSSVTTPANAKPALSIVKTAGNIPVTAVGQDITFTYVITNTGNQTLTSVSAADPDAPNLVCGPAEVAPGGTLTCSAVYRVTQDDIDRGTLNTPATAKGISPVGGQVDGKADLVVAMPAAKPGMTMTKVGAPDPFGAVGSLVTYTFTVKNTGNVTLFNTTVTDAIVTPAFSCVIPRLDVGQTDTSCQLFYPVTQDDFDGGRIVNAAVANATDPFGTAVKVDVQTTTAAIASSPAIEVTKTSSTTGIVVGATVTYDLFVENTGDITVIPTAIVDTMTRRDTTSTALDTPFTLVSGDTDNDSKIDVDETWVYRATKVIVQADINAGGFNNSAKVSVKDTRAVPATASDVSDDGDDTDGNTTNDVTEFEIVPGPAIDTSKTVKTAGTKAGDIIVYTITARNVGNVTMTGATIVDTMKRRDGVDVTANIIALTQTAGGAGNFEPTDAFVWELSYKLTQEDVDAGGLSNSATVSAQPPTGPRISDVSDNANDADGNQVNDATLLEIAPAPVLDVVKTIAPRADATARVMAGEVLTYRIAVSNNGNVTLNQLTLEDTITNAAGDTAKPDTVKLVQGGAADVVQAGETLIFEAAYTITQADVDSGQFSNTAFVGVRTPAGVLIEDRSDDGDDTDGNTVDDTTDFIFARVSTLVATKTAQTPERIAEDTFRVTFTITANNTGNVTQKNMVINDNLKVFVPPAGLISGTITAFDNFDGTAAANPNYDGDKDINLAAAGVELLPGEIGSITLVVVYDTTGDQYPVNKNIVEINSDQLFLVAAAAASVAVGADPDITATKTAFPTKVQLGQTVRYTLTFKNGNPIAESKVTLVDDMPAGVIYSPGTARYNGVVTPAPRRVGRSLLWENLTIAPNALVTVTFDARVVGEIGEMVNRAYMLSGDGSPLSNVAAATITRSPEAVFDCGDVIGRVFDDRNMNGYPDGDIPEDRRRITDQSYAGDKQKIAPREVIIPGADYEEGLPNVRLSTVDGTIIVTDEFGRFSVPCAALPGQTGANFSLKLDERTLPTGYRVTTENPRVMRLTRGTSAKMNFGAAIARVVDIDLMATAFQRGTAAPTTALATGIETLVAQLRDVPSILRLSYYTQGEGREIARRRLDAVENIVRDRWSNSGRYRLLIERTIRPLQ